MRTFILFFGCLTSLLLIPLVSRATHQVGGQLEMQYIGDVPGHFRVIVTNYLEDGTQGIARQSSTGIVGIFRIRDNVQMTSFTVQQTGSREPVVYTNAFCASQRNLNFVVWTYQAVIQLSPATYNDPQGYYMSYQTRNRNAGINNISSPDQTGFTFYLEFPAIQQNGQYLTNSSPHFGTLNGEYVCRGDQFTFAFGGKDPDGDNLRYSMVTPLNQKGTGQNNVSAGPYPDVSWLSGYSATNPMPGNPTLSVNELTGQLSVTATELGLYVFAVKVEEFRNGIKIGEVRRDFQLLVIDCPPQTTPDPAVQFTKFPAMQSSTICKGDSIFLQAAANPNWNYQWRQNGTNITGATSASLTVREPGDYMVVVSQKTTCSKTGNSQDLTVKVIGSAAQLFEGGHLCATTGTVHLTATGDPDATYVWYRDGQVLSGQTSVNLDVTQAGKYWSTLTNRTYGCKANTDTTTITRSAAVVPLIQSASGQNRICPAASLPLQGSGGLTYGWQQNGAKVGDTGAQYTTSSPGTFVLTATDGFGCEGTSSPLTITQLASLTVSFDSIPGVCGSNVPDYALTASPTSGTFTGDGVTGSTFSAKTAGVGNHLISYALKAAPECAATVVTRTAVVAPIPTIQLADSLVTFRGNTFQLNPTYTGNPNQFTWTSAQYLTDPTAANPTITDINGDIRYVLDVKNSTGCSARDSIYILVVARVWIPDAFSPNGDGLNDTWEIFGIDAFPDATVTVFNRWGEIIYSSGKGYENPFDGTLNGGALPSGLYAYVVRTIPGRPIIRGSLMLVR